MEIEASSRLNRELIRPFELTMLRKRDSVFMKEAASMSGREAEPLISSRPFSVKLFDAWFS
jgi:hypothetical protein